MEIENIINKGCDHILYRKDDFMMRISTENNIPISQVVYAYDNVLRRHFLDKSCAIVFTNPKDLENYIDILFEIQAKKFKLFKPKYPIIEIKLYNSNPRFAGVSIINSVNGSTVIVPREEIVSVTQRMLTIYENMKEEKCPAKEN